MNNTILVVVTAWVRPVVSDTINDSLLNPSSYMYPSSRCNNGTVGRSMYSLYTSLCIRWVWEWLELNSIIWLTFVRSTTPPLDDVPLVFARDTVGNYKRNLQKEQQGRDAEETNHFDCQWESCLKLRPIPSAFYTWEGNKLIESKNCVTFLWGSAYIFSAV